VRVHHKSFYVYRCWADDELLYVGMSGNLFGRLGHHAVGKPWWPDVTDVDWDVFDSWTDASFTERWMITTYGPVHNLAGLVYPYTATFYRMSEEQRMARMRRHWEPTWRRIPELVGPLSLPPPQPETSRPLPAPRYATPPRRTDSEVVNDLIRRWESEQD
jgi:hypothetical protein